MEGETARTRKAGGTLLAVGERDAMPKSAVSVVQWYDHHQVATCLRSIQHDILQQQYTWHAMHQLHRLSLASTENQNTARIYSVSRCWASATVCVVFP